MADTVFAVSGFGRNRKERALTAYLKIMGNELATFVKLADRAANMLYSKQSGSSMYGKYRAEYPSFRYFLRTTDLNLMWDALDEINEFKP